jgi:hypothetical protein
MILNWFVVVFIDSLMQFDKGLIDPDREPLSGENFDKFDNEVTALGFALCRFQSFFFQVFFGKIIGNILLLSFKE